MSLGLVAIVVINSQLRPVYYPPSIMDPPPGQFELQARAFGDPEYLFRSMALGVQMAGDTGGQITPMQDYDYDYVVAWLESLDSLNSKSEWPVGMAARYFSWSQNKGGDAEKLARYIGRSVDQHPELKLQWMAAAILLSQVRAENPDLALELAYQLASYDTPGIEPLAWQYPAYVLDNMGRHAEAREHMEWVLREKADRMDALEIEFVKDFQRQMTILEEQRGR